MPKRSETNAQPRRWFRTFPTTKKNFVSMKISAKKKKRRSGTKKPRGETNESSEANRPKLRNPSKKFRGKADYGSKRKKRKNFPDLSSFGG